LTNNTDYVDSIPYIHKWTSACKPYEIDLNLKFHGMESRLGEQDIRVVDLGCGTGAMLLLLAESMPNSEFLGIDINPEHINWANRFARKSNLKNIEFRQEAFSTTLSKKYGTFDLVICQGIYSWVSELVRQEVLECIDRLASPNAALQISWNTEAGCAQLIPLRSILHEIVKTDDRDQKEAWSSAFSMIEMIESMEVPWFEKNPVGRHRVNGWKKSDFRYLVHEYFNGSWHLSNFNKISGALSQYGFEFGGYSLFERWRLNNPDIKFDVTHSGLEELITELAMCVPHRNDTFVRGRQLEKLTGMGAEYFACSQPTGLVPVQVFANQTKDTTGIMYQCLEGPKSVSELLRIYSTDEPAAVIAKIRNEISRGMIIRVDAEVADVENIHADVNIKMNMEYSSAFSRTLIDDAELLADFSCFPSRATRGGIRIPSTIAQLVDVFCKSNDEHEWFLESQRRLATCGVEIGEEELRSEMQSCVKSWIPFMLFHKVLHT